MTLGGPLRQVARAATVVPRLARAAMRAGVGPAGTVTVLRISEAAARKATTHGRGQPGRMNAMRHFIWQALITAHFGHAVAVQIGHAQEVGTPNLRDSEVDQHNNLVGQEYGAANGAELTAGSIADASALLVPVALAKWNSGELIWLDSDRGR